MKTIINILLLFWILFSFWSSLHLWYADENLRVSTGQARGSQTNEVLEGFFNNKFFKVGGGWDDQLIHPLINIAWNLKNLFFVIATIFFLIIVFRLIFAENSEEEFSKFKKGFIWITIWIIVMQVAFSFVSITFDKDVWASLADSLMTNLIEPFIQLLSYAASFFFIAIAIFSYYRIITANGNDEKISSWKKSVVFAIVGFLVITVARKIVKFTYDKTYCDIRWWVTVTSCSKVEWLTDGVQFIVTVINWVNGFVWILVVLMIIYTWAQLIFSQWDEEKVKKAKKSILYIIIWMVILISNYFILTFFLKESMIGL